MLHFCYLFATLKLGVNMKTVFISGGTRGVGRQLVIDFCKNGYKVIFCYKNSTDLANKLVEELTKQNYLVEGYRLDIADNSSVQNFFTKLYQTDKIDILINNAGIALPQQMLVDTTIAQWNEIFNTNVTGVFNVTTAVVGKMMFNGFGRIINIGSMWGVNGGSCEVCYSASKGAIISFTKALAKELASSNITVNCLSLGVIDTDMNSHLTNQDIQELIVNTPLSRIGKPSDITGMALLLAGDNGSFITGQNIIIDGGFTL